MEYLKVTPCLLRALGFKEVINSDGYVNTSKSEKNGASINFMGSIEDVAVEFENRKIGLPKFIVHLMNCAAVIESRKFTDGPKTLKYPFN